MTDYPITRTLQEQFRRSWKIWTDMIRNVPEDQWATGENEYLIPVRQAYHTLQAAELYASSRTLAENAKQGTYDLDWEGPVNGMPSREEMLAAFARMEETVSRWLADLTDAGLLAKETACPWTGATVLDRALYLLRHTHHHLGELAAELVRRGIPRAQWTA